MAMQFVEGGAGAKCFCAGGTQDNDPGMRVIAGAVDLVGEGIEQAPGQGIALGMIKFDCGDPVVGLRSDMTLADLSKHIVWLV